MRETNPLRQLAKKPTLRNGVRAMCAHVWGARKQAVLVAYPNSFWSVPARAARYTNFVPIKLNLSK